MKETPKAVPAPEEILINADVLLSRATELYLRFGFSSARDIAQCLGVSLKAAEWLASNLIKDERN